MEHFSSIEKENPKVYPESCEISLEENIVKMSLNLLERVESGDAKILTSVSKSSLTRGINGQNLDAKTVRNIACIFYNTENFAELLKLAPVCMHETLELANNRLTHKGEVPYEVATNPKLIQLWNLCSGYGCTRELGEKYFGDKFEKLISILVEKKIVVKSVLIHEKWLMSGDMISTREDGLNHYENMFKMTKDRLLDPENGKFAQLSGSMKKSSYLNLLGKIEILLIEQVLKESNLVTDENEIKFNFQFALCLLNDSEVKNEIK